MATTESSEWNFQFLPLAGKLKGRDFEQQTEDAINGIGTRLTSLEGTVEAAIAEITDVASQAYELASDASGKADANASSITNIDTRVTAVETVIADLGEITIPEVDSLFDEEWDVSPIPVRTFRAITEEEILNLFE